LQETSPAQEISLKKEPPEAPPATCQDLFPQKKSNPNACNNIPPHSICVQFHLKVHTLFSAIPRGENIGSTK
jgi:hypothetical protein